MVYQEAKEQWYPAKKVMRLKGLIAGAAGDAGDCVRFLDWVKHDFADKKKPKFSESTGDKDASILLMVTPEGIFTMDQDDPYPEEVDAQYHAIGSGAKAALGAFFMGATIEQALEAAAKHDPYTRGPFTILKLKE